LAAGVLRHAAAICAVAAPTSVSYIRLAPHRWSAGWACLGEGNREALLRIPPPNPLARAEPAEQVHLEFRAGDGACSPHFALALLVLAGLEGIREQLEPASVVGGDPDALSQAERDALGVGRLPSSLEQALTAFEADPLVCVALSENLRVGYSALKRTEMALLEGLGPEEACERYAAVF
jgi:glutamine synthetase